MGLTILEPNNMWNTMPAILTNAEWKYICISIWKKIRVIHFMGEPSETRHVVMKNEQAIISQAGQSTQEWVQAATLSFGVWLAKIRPLMTWIMFQWKILNNNVRRIITVECFQPMC